MSGRARGAPPEPQDRADRAADPHRSAAARSDAPLVLVGLPGVGKTAVGRAVAERLGWDFLDFDEETERREGRTITALFAERGEAYFRACERALTAEFAGRARIVLAPGGGWVMQPGVMDLLRPPARIIHLAASPATAAARMGAARAARPLLVGGDPVTRLTALLRDRAAAYARADVVVDTEVIDFSGVVSRVCALAPVRGAE